MTKFEQRVILIRELIGNDDFAFNMQLSGNAEWDYRFIDESFTDSQIQEMHDQQFMEYDN